MNTPELPAEPGGTEMMGRLISPEIILLGIAATLIASLVNLYFTFKTSKRTSFTNTVTSERVKWIAKVRENISTLLSLVNKWIYNRPGDYSDLLKDIERLNYEIRLQLNPRDKEDNDLQELLRKLPNMKISLSDTEFDQLRDKIVTATQTMLKREWDKVKDEAQYGDLRERERSKFLKFVQRMGKG